MKLADVTAYCRARVDELSAEFKQIPRENDIDRVENLAKQTAYKDVLDRITASRTAP